MYRISDTQIDFILNDIRARGVEMEDLQLNLLDHVCCIIEHELEENGDFESFYQETIRSFYKDALWEIEEETISLLTFKHYYTMKKLMLLSGIFTAVTMAVGIWFKYMHWPGASLFLPLGIFSGSLVFLPLLFTLKAREQQKTKDRIVLAAGTLSAMLLSLSFVFKIMGWPHSIDMMYISAAIILLVFLPLYLFSGLRNPATKINTIVTSILVVMGYSLLFSLIRPPRAVALFDAKNTQNFIRSERILQTEQKWTEVKMKPDTTLSSFMALGKQISEAGREAKSAILEYSTGAKVTSEDLEGKSLVIVDGAIANDDESLKRIKILKGLVDEYNSAVVARKEPGLNPIPVKSSFVQFLNTQDLWSISVLNTLNEITQVQMFVLQNERELLATR